MKDQNNLQWHLKNFLDELQKRFHLIIPQKSGKKGGRYINSDKGLFRICLLLRLGFF